MNRERFLLYMLAGIFTFQAAVFGLGVIYCGRHGGLGECPNIGKRYDQTFNVMVATCLALLTGSALSKKGE